MNSLRAKLLLPFILGTLTLTIFLALYTYSSVRATVRETMQLIATAKTEQTASSMSLLFKSNTTIFHNLASDPHVAQFLLTPTDPAVRESTVSWLEATGLGNEYIRDILLIDTRGKCILSSNPGLIGQSFTEKDYVQQALRGAIVMGETSVGKITKKFTTVIAGPADSSTGIVGAVVIINDFPKLLDYNPTKYDPQIISVSLIAPDGEFKAHIDKDRMGNQENKNPSLYQKLSQAGAQGGLVEYTLANNNFTGYAKVEPFSRWVVVSSGLVAEVFAPAYKVGFVVAGISTAFLFAISFIVLRFANGILRSLFALIGYASHVSEGKLSLALPATKRKDELGVLQTALKLLVENLQSMLQKSAEANRMKSQFLANMSHEIRTPLNAILGLTHLSLRDTTVQGKNREFTSQIALAANSLLGVINDILDLSKVEAGMLTIEKVPFDLGKTVQGIVGIHQSNAKTKGLFLILEYPENAPKSFLGDSLRLGQILNNLIGNAIKFTHSGGVTVQCLCSRTEDEASLSNTMEATLAFHIMDTGIGIAQGTLPRLFEPFTQADASTTREYGGTGLGLVISRRLVTLMGGELTVESTLGQGTKFSFTIPVEIQAEPIQNTDAPNFCALLLPGKRILIAEDNEVNQYIIQELIAPSQAILTVVANGKEALDAVEQQDYDLILMDMQMPIMGGMEATLEIRKLEKGKSLPIIAVTANAMDEEKDKGLACGMNDYLTKPIDPSELMCVLQKWLNP